MEPLFAGGVMIINLAEPAANAALNAIGKLINGGSIELLSASGAVLVTIKLADPATHAAGDGELLFAEIAEGRAMTTGQAKFGRILNRNGSEVFSCDVGPAESDAVIRLTPVLITATAPVKLDTFKLVMPQ